MLLEMRCQIEAMRALGCWSAAAMDRAAKHPDPAVRLREQRRVDVLIPVVKGLSTTNIVKKILGNHNKE